MTSCVMGRLLLCVALLLPSLSFPADECPRDIQASGLDLVRQLESLGYDSQVARKMCERVPAIAALVVDAGRAADPPVLRRLSPVVAPDGYRYYQDPNRPEERLRAYAQLEFKPHPNRKEYMPVRLYRGVTVPPEAFSPTRGPEPEMHGQIFHTRSVATARTYALSARHGAAPVTEAMVVEIELPRFLVYEGVHPIVRFEEMPDVTPYVKRIGRVRPETAEIEWR